MVIYFDLWVFLFDAIKIRVWHGLEDEAHYAVGELTFSVILTYKVTL